MPSDTNRDDNNQNSSEEHKHGKYGDYKISEEEKVIEKKYKRPSFFSRVISTIVLALIFGFLSSVVFLGVLSGTVTDNGFIITNKSLKTVKEYIKNIGKRDKEEKVQIKAKEQERPQAQRTDNNGVVEVSKIGLPSVVAVTSVSIKEIPAFYGLAVAEYPETGTGSGVIVGENDKSFFIATNNHVVKDSNTLTVAFNGNDVLTATEETQKLASGDIDPSSINAAIAKVIGSDVNRDLAVISVDKKDIPKNTLKKIKVANIDMKDDLKVGQQVVAIGNALGFGQSVTSGWLSALNRTVTVKDKKYTGLIQTDATINPGNSGGALLNMNGQLIGINSAKLASSVVEGTGYAIPMYDAMPIIQKIIDKRGDAQLKVNEKPGYIGVAVADLSKQVLSMYQMPEGAFVIWVKDAGPAENAGIQKNDIIVAIDGQKILSKDDLTNELKYYKKGDSVDITIARNDNRKGYKERSVRVIVGEKGIDEP